MAQGTGTHFPSISDEQIKSESTVEIVVKALSTPDAPFVATLDARRTMSRVMGGFGFAMPDGAGNVSDATEKLAAHYSTLYGVEITKQDIAIARTLEKVWISPTLENGELPGLDDFVKLGLVDGFALMEIWVAWLGVARDAIQGIIAEARANFHSQTPPNNSSS